MDGPHKLAELTAAVADYVSEFRGPPLAPPKILAVSKKQSVEAIRALYDAGHRAFGENYVQELVDKAAALPEDIDWHMIGPLQRNKVNMLVGVPNLHVVESVDRLEVAEALEKT